jgi:hypothetical protein
MFYWGDLPPSPPIENSPSLSLKWARHQNITIITSHVSQLYLGCRRCLLCAAGYVTCNAVIRSAYHHLQDGTRWSSNSISVIFCRIVYTYWMTGMVCQGISGMNYRKVCESGGTEIVIFLSKLALKCTLGSRFAMVRFTTIQFYDPWRVAPSTPDCSVSLSQLKRPFSI